MALRESHMHRLRSLYSEDANDTHPERWLDQDLEGMGIS